MIPYYSPNLTIKKILLSFFKTKSEEKCIKFYKEYSGKKYILITSSCRIALYLAHCSLPLKGKVLISPLICTTAIEPIVAAQNEILYTDISEYDMNMDMEKLPSKLPPNTISLQTTYFGGCPLEMDRLMEYVKQHNLVLIEDCAQGFGSSYKGKNIGSFGDVSCFSMVKTAYGISGGILATDNEQIYQRAKMFQMTFKSASKGLELYRLFRNYIESCRTNKIGSVLYSILLKARPQKYSTKKDFSCYLTKPNMLSLKVFATQLTSFKELHQKRINVALKYCEILSMWYDGTNFYSNSIYKTVPTKLFFYKKDINSKLYIEKLNNMGIEAKHLQQKHNCFYQDFAAEAVYKNSSLDQCKTFMGICNKIVSFPLIESFKDSYWERIREKIKNKYQ